VQDGVFDPLKHAPHMCCMSNLVVLGPSNGVDLSKGPQFFSGGGDALYTYDYTV